MGIYINPRHMSKEQWVQENGRYVVEWPEFCLSTNPKNGVEERCCILVDNGAFTALAVCFSQEEQDHFRRSFEQHGDLRPFWLFMVPEATVRTQVVF